MAAGFGRCTLVLCLITALRTEEARALPLGSRGPGRCEHRVWRSVRLGGDNETSKSGGTSDCRRRPWRRCGSIARGKTRKVVVGELWRDYELVFTTTVGIELDAANVRRY